MNKFPISPLFIPGNKIEWIAKTFDKGADSIIVDLEDSVPLGVSGAVSADALVIEPS